MSIGKCDRLVNIQRQSSTQDAAGQPVLTWSTLATVWANVRYLSGMETVRADAQTAVAKASIRLRRRTDVTAAMRVVLGATTFEVKAVLPNEDRVYMDLACEVIS